MVAWFLQSSRLPVFLSLTSSKEFTSCFEQDFVTSGCFTILVLSFTSSRCTVLCNFIFMFCLVLRNWITCFITSFVSLFQHHTSYHKYTRLILLFPPFPVDLPYIVVIHIHLLVLLQHCSVHTSWIFLFLILISLPSSYLWQFLLLNFLFQSLSQGL